MVVVQMGPSLACIGKKKSSNWHNPIFVWKSTFWQTLCGFGKPVPFLSWPIKAPKLALASFIYIKKCQPTTRGSLVLWSFHAHGLFWLCIWSTMTVLLPPPEGPTNPADVPASRTKDTPLRTSRLHGVIARFWWMFLWKWRVRSQISGGLPGFLAWAKRTCQKDSGQRGKKSTQD